MHITQLDMHVLHSSLKLWDLTSEMYFPVWVPLSLALALGSHMSLVFAPVLVPQCDCNAVYM